MTLQQLIYFQTIARVHNFTRAAEMLFITQPNLSHAIRQLETELKAQLFVRQGRAVTLTPYGQIYLTHVEEALRELEEGRRRLEEYTAPGEGTVLLSYISSLSEYIPFLASRFLMANPDLHTHFQMSQSSHDDLCRNISTLACNLGFSIAPDSGNLASCPLGMHRLVVIVSDRHPWADRERISLKELDGQKFVAYTLNCRIRCLIDQLLAQYNAAPVIVSELMYDNLVFGMVSADFGVAIVPEPLGMQPRHIHVLGLEESEALREIHMIWSRDNYLPPAAACFRDFVISRQLTLDRFRQTITG